jgi:hypothetical protein
VMMMVVMVVMRWCSYIASDDDGIHDCSVHDDIGWWWYVVEIT